MGKKGLTLLIILCLNSAFVTCGASRGKKIALSGTDIDCVDFYKQPAFDNPLLKNHTIQRTPSGDVPRSQAYGMPRAMYGFNGCPDGMIPTRRNPTGSFGLDLADMSTNQSPEVHVASIQMTGEIIFGGRASVGIHSPRCEAHQVTGSFIRLIDIEGMDNLLAGWAIYPVLYGDTRPHLTIYWSSNAKGGGCFNMLCPGFVQVDKNVMPGAYFDPTSVYDGNTYETTVEICQDPNTKNWWFILNNVNIGYWPKELFSNLEKGVRRLFFGGVAAADENHNNPQMGFGNFPGNSIKQAGFMRHIKYLDNLRNGVDLYHTKVVESSPGCYKVGDTGMRGIDEYIVLFGGPGGAQCP